MLKISQSQSAYAEFMSRIKISKRLFVTILLLLQMAIGPLRAQDTSSLGPVAAPIPPGLETVEYYSPAVDRRMKFDIVLPEGYYQSEARYPVLYLLHGYMQNYTVWGRNLAAAFYARNLNDLIVVFPDAGNSWFVNYASSEEGQRNNWEDHIINDVIGQVDKRYRTEARREGRAIAGLSMGGFGAYAMGLRHSDMFVSIGSTSGALSHARSSAAAIRAGKDRSRTEADPQRQARIDEADAFISKIIDVPGFSTQDERTPKGVDFATAEQAEAYDPFTIIYEVPRSQMPHIYMDAGTEDGLVKEAREMAALLMLNDVPFDYMQSRGRHNSEYWRRSIGHMMTIQNEVMQRALGKRP